MPVTAIEGAVTNPRRRIRRERVFVEGRLAVDETLSRPTKEAKEKDRGRRELSHTKALALDRHAVK
jgi:hypothetical protein